MRYPGHVGAALVAYSPIAFASLRVGEVRLALAGAAVAVGLASLPDVDLSTARLHHRGGTHTVWFAILVGAGCAVAFVAVGSRLVVPRTASPGAFGFVVGTTTVLAHVAVDALTPMGVAPLAPLGRRRISLGTTRSADPVANRRLFLLGLATAAATAALGLRVAPPTG